MEYCIVEDGVIVNMIVAEADFAAEIGALPAYDGAAIGGAYTPPPPEPEPPTTDERVAKLEAELVSAQSAAAITFVTLCETGTIDTVTAKLLVIQRAKAAGVPVISSMGTGNKLDPSRFRITDIAKTAVCPLARVMRRELKSRGIAGVDVLWSDEPPRTPLAAAPPAPGRRQTPGSVAFVPPVAGLLIAGHVVRSLCSIQP